MMKKKASATKALLVMVLTLAILITGIPLTTFASEELPKVVVNSYIYVGSELVDTVAQQTVEVTAVPPAEDAEDGATKYVVYPPSYTNSNYTEPEWNPTFFEYKEGEVYNFTGTVSVVQKNTYTFGYSARTIDFAPLSAGGVLQLAPGATLPSFSELFEIEGYTWEWYQGDAPYTGELVMPESGLDLVAVGTPTNGGGSDDGMFFSSSVPAGDTGITGYDEYFVGLNADEIRVLYRRPGSTELTRFNFSEEADGDKAVVGQDGLKLPAAFETKASNRLAVTGWSYVAGNQTDGYTEQPVGNGDIVDGVLAANADEATTGPGRVLVATVETEYKVTYEVRNAQGTYETATFADGEVAPEYASVLNELPAPQYVQADEENPLSFGGWQLADYNGNVSFPLTLTGPVTLRAYYGEAPTDGMTAQVTLENLMALRPQLETYSLTLETSEDGAEPGFVALTGSVTSALNIELKNVKFVIRVTDNDERWPDNTTDTHVSLEASTALPGSHGVVNGNTIEITVDSIKPASTGHTTSGNYGSVLFSFENNFTPNGTVATFEILSVSCGNVTLTREQWEAANVGWKDGTSVTSTAIASNQWALKAVTTANPDTAVSNLVEGTLPYGTTEYAPSAQPAFTMGAFTNPASLAYVDANGVSFITRLEGVALEGNNALTFDPALITALTDGAWKPLYNMPGVDDTPETGLLALFEKSFGLAGIEDKWQVEIRYNGGALEMRYTRLIEDSSTPEANVIGVTSVTPVLTVKKFFFNEANKLGLEKYEGQYKMSYLTDEENAWYVTPEMKDGSLTSTKKELITAEGAVVGITVDVAKSLEEVVKTQVGAASKTKPGNWYATASGYDSSTAQLGLVGELSRNFVADAAITLPDTGNTIVSNRYWFHWSWDSKKLPGKTFNALVDKVSIIEQAGGAFKASTTGTVNATSGWSSNIAPIGFMTPTVGSATTKWTLTIDFEDKTTAVLTGTGTDDAAQSSITGTGSGNLTYHGKEAKVDNTTTRNGHVFLVTGSPVASYRLDYEKTGATDEQIAEQQIVLGWSMRVLFEHKGEAAKDTTTGKFLTGTTAKNMYNNSRIEADYRSTDKDGNTKTVTYAVEKANTVTHKAYKEDYGHNKSGVNVSHSGQGNRPGDIVMYTITFKVPDSNTVGFVENLWIRDLASPLVDFSAAGLPQNTVAITRNNSSTKKGDMTLLDKSGNTLGVAASYEFSMADYKVRTTTYPETIEGLRDQTAQEFIWKFDGTLYKGETVTITYYGKLLDTVKTDDKVYNEFYYLTWPKNPGPGTGGLGGEYKWEKGGDWTIHIVDTLYFGDVMMTFVPQVYTGEPGVDGKWPVAVYNTHQHYYYYQGNEVAGIVTGGLVRAEADLYAPQFIIHLPANADLNPLTGNKAPDGTTLYDGLVYDVQYLQMTNLGTHNDNAATNDRTLTDVADSKSLGKPEVETVTTSNGVYLIVTFPDAKLDYKANETISFRVSLKANDQVINPAGTTKNGGVLFTGLDKANGSRVNLYQNNHLQKSGNWPDNVSRNSNNGNDGDTHPIFTGIGYLEDNTAGLYAPADDETIVTLAPLNKLDLTKGTVGNQKEIKEGGKITYTVNVTRGKITATGQSEDAFKNSPYRASIPDYMLYQVVDILPPGQFVETENADGTGAVKPDQVTLSFNNQGTEPALDPGKVSYTADLVSYTDKINNKDVTYQAQRVIVSFEGGLAMKYGDSSNKLTLTYAATQKNIDIIKKDANRPETAKVNNYVSIFYYEKDTVLTTANKKREIFTAASDELKAAWWTGEDYDFGTGTSFFEKVAGQPKQLTIEDYTRLEASYPLTIREDRIGPGIVKKHRNSREYYNEENKDYIGVGWDITVYNKNGSGKAMDNYYVVDVLPFGTEFVGMLTNDITNPQTYYNTSGQQVLVWHFNSDKHTVAANKSMAFSFQTKTPAKAFDRQTNTAYVIPQEAYFTHENVAKDGNKSLGIYREGREDLRMLTMSDESIAENAKLYKLMDSLRYQKAVESSDWVMILNQFSASAYKMVTNGGTKPEDTTTSAEPYRTVPVIRGGRASFSYEIQNNSKSSDSYHNLEFYDVVARVGDTYTGQNRPRESGWDLDMVPNSIEVVRYKVDGDGKEISGSRETLKQTTGTETEQQGQYTVSFTKDVPGLYHEGMLDHKTWVKSWEWTGDEKVLAFNVILNETEELGSYERLLITWEMDVPLNIAPAALEAKSYNSGLFYFKRGVGGQERSYSGEPEKVGLHLADLDKKDLSITIQKDLTDDTLNAGEKDTIHFRLYKVNDIGRNEPFNLYNSGAIVAPELKQTEAEGDPNNPEFFGLFSIELGDGEVNGGTITGLPEGKYYVEEQLTTVQKDKYTYASNGFWFSLLANDIPGEMNNNGETVTFYNTTEVPPVLSLEIRKYLSDDTVAGNVTRTFEYELQRFEGSWQPFSLDTQGLSFTDVKGFAKLAANGRFTIEATSDGGAYGMKINGLPEGSYRFVEIDSLGYTMHYYTQQGTLNAVNQNLILDMLNYLGNPPILLVPPTPPTPLGAPLRFGGVDMIDPWNPEIPTAPGQGENSTPTPIVNPEGAHWSLLNLMCALFCGITSLIMLIMMIARKLKRKDDEDEQAEAMELGQEYDAERAEKRKGGFIWRVAAGVVAVGAIIAFLLTEDIRNPMIWACEWTPMMVIFAIAQVLVMLGLRNTLRQADPEEWEDIDLDPQGGVA